VGAYCGRWGVWLVFSVRAECPASAEWGAGHFVGGAAARDPAPVSQAVETKMGTEPGRVDALDAGLKSESGEGQPSFAAKPGTLGL
jgi:hypothetical protein